jgi:large subunit ribosomal protein L31
MKKNLHPRVRQVVFKDVSSDFSFLGTSTLDSKETIKWEDGKSYPLIRLEISSASHPFFTGKQRVHDAEGRIARFKKKYGGKWIIQANLSGEAVTHFPFLLVKVLEAVSTDKVKKAKELEPTMVNGLETLICAW